MGLPDARRARPVSQASGHVKAPSPAPVATRTRERPTAQHRRVRQFPETSPSAVASNTDYFWPVLVWGGASSEPHPSKIAPFPSPGALTSLCQAALAHPLPSLPDSPPTAAIPTPFPHHTHYSPTLALQAALSDTRRAKCRSRLSPQYASPPSAGTAAIPDSPHLIHHARRVRAVTFARP